MLGQGKTSILKQNMGHLTFWGDTKRLINWYLRYDENV